MRASSIAALLVVFMFASSAAAQASDRERAESHFNAGRKLRANKRCDLAIDEFRQSIELEPGIGAHLNLGDCLEMTGKLPEAFAAFKAAETLARREEDQRLDEARKSGARVEAKLVRVVIKDEEPDLRLSVDGTPVGPKPWNIVVTPDADHVILGTTTDHRRWEERVHGKAGDMLRLTPVLTTTTTERPPTPVDTKPSAPPERERPFPTAAVVTGGIGAAALVAGSIFGIMAMSARSDLADKIQSNPLCTGGYPGGSCDPRARDALDPIESRASFTSGASTVCFIAGAGLILTGAVLYFALPSGSKKTAQLNW